MRALITSDWHLTDNIRDEYRWGFVERWLPNFLIEEHPAFMIFAGDATEAKGNHSAELVNRLVSAFSALADLCPIVFIPGNHDGLSPEFPFFKFLSSLRGDRIYWVPNPLRLHTVPNVPTAFVAGKRTLLLPYTRNYEKDWEEIDFKSYDWVIAHQSFAGAKSESGFTLSGIPLSYFPKGLRIISGDVHKPQTYGALTYIGSPYTVDHGDDFEGRVLLWDGEEFDSIPVPGPQKRLFEVSSIKELLKQKPAVGDIVKVRLDISSYDEWPEAKVQIEEWVRARGVTLHIATPIIQQAVTRSSKIETKSMTDEEILEAYAQKRNVSKAYVSSGFKLL